jgi:hypothetical protein
VLREGDILSKTDGVKRNLKLSCGELRDWYSSPDIMGVIKLGADEMGGACGMRGGGERWIQDAGGETRREERNWNALTSM